MARIKIGTSGWHYPHWIGPFYPEGMASKDFLPHYAETFAAVEINNTFYRLPQKDALRKWRDGTPKTFVFACKASRYITHMKKLKDPGVSTSRFFKAIHALEPKLGPILFQLPPRWHINLDRLDAFLSALPSQYRFAFEFRDATWHTADVYELLQKYNVAFCIFDLNGRTSPLELTADFAYVRLHGPDGPYKGQYNDRALAAWAERFLGFRGQGGMFSASLIMTSTVMPCRMLYAWHR